MRIGGGAPDACPRAVVAAVHLDDEPARRSEEVDDAASDEGLATESDAELGGEERLPKRALGAVGERCMARAKPSWRVC